MKGSSLYPQFLIILRGPAGAGKSTLAKVIQSTINTASTTDRIVATIDTDLFNWEIVPGESNKALVFKNLSTLSQNYLLAGYSVIISGLIITTEELGALGKLRQYVIDRQIAFIDFYCSASLDLVLERNLNREKDVPTESVRAWWHLAEADKANVIWDLNILDMNRTLPYLTAEVLSKIEAACL